MTTSRKQAIVHLLKGIETGDPTSVEVICPDKYIQHNPQTQVGRDGLVALFRRLAATNPRVNIVRIFSDGDFVFAHTEYDFSQSRVGFEVFRFEGEQTVEHWDNIQLRLPENTAGQDMVSGPVTAEDHAFTESNREVVSQFVDTVLIERQLAKITGFVAVADYVDHDPNVPDGADVIAERLAEQEDGMPRVRYQKCHRVLAEGNFVLSVCEGDFEGKHTSFYDLFRLTENRIVEHWNTKETVPDRSTWKNQNGKF